MNIINVNNSQIAHFFKEESGCLQCTFINKDFEKLRIMHEKIKNIANENIQIISVIVKKEKIKWVILYKELTIDLCNFWKGCSTRAHHPINFDVEELDHELILKQWNIPIRAFVSTNNFKENSEIEKVKYPIIAIKQDSCNNYFSGIFSDYIESIESINFFSQKNSRLEICYKNQWNEIVLKSSVANEFLVKLNQKAKSILCFLMFLKIKKIDIPKYLRMEILSQANFFYWKNKNINSSFK